MFNIILRNGGLFVSCFPSLFQSQEAIKNPSELVLIITLISSKITSQSQYFLQKDSLYWARKKRSCVKWSRAQVFTFNNEKKNKQTKGKTKCRGTNFILLLLSFLCWKFRFTLLSSFSCLGIFAIIHAQKNWFAHICSPKICRKYINTQE